MNPQAPAPSAPRFCPTCGVSLAGQQNHGCVAPPPDEPYLRYCASCGAAFDAAAQSCPSCGLSWRRPSAYELPALAVLLTELQDWYRGRVIDRGQYVRLRDAYAAHLPARAPAAPLVAAAWPPETPTHAGGVEAPPPAPPRPPRPPRDSLGQWAAKRQADIVLYLGAFFLSVAALIFVNYQGEALGSLGRVALLAGYTAAFFAAGVAAPRWERVREAGHVFIALSAIFTPLTFLLLYTEIFRDRGLPADVVWLLGATFCFLFYGALALRGFGRWYTAPMTLALLIGWGALASVLDLPQEWAGAWYLALAAAAAT
ncbi:MAG: zinc ribbon domain-containing protein, partial [Dehalococcoidia bacterium]